ncbi:PilX N-terminal domain-containing pilus assembly protein [Neobacillus cucumis]|uniref:Uncharacterized protein n=1 Tax=Neobacillus cucumis TaxID=1740721 RepID=A0A2N5H731_9BACI|nr:PilX N-terminal domain-containing pilus assembly protein [Neobacillus cucumis]PLS01314.1 hypothetical protein CVD27_26500 [Neobacillus cucumis]
MMKKKPLIFQSLKNEHGMALVVVLMILVVVSILGLGLMGLASSNMKMSTGERNNQSSYYVAESGATLLMNDVTTQINNIYKSAKTKDEFFSSAESILNNYSAEQQSTNFEKNFGTQPVAKYKIEKVDPATKEYKVISTGTVDNRTKTVEQKFRLIWDVNFPKTAVFVDNKITVDSGSAIINGSIGTNSIENEAITLHDSGNLPSDAEIIVGPNAPNQGKDVVNLNYFTNITVLEEKISLELKPFKETPAQSYPTTLGPIAVPSDGNIKITSNTTINNMPNPVVLNNVTIDNNAKLNIDIGSNNVEMYVNNFVLNNNSVFNVIGTGTLSLYVNGSLTINNAVINEVPSQKDKLIIYLRKSTDPTKPKTITASSNGTGINCSIFAEDAQFNFTGGTFRGRFATGGSVEIGGNNVIEGAIIAKNLHLQGNSSLTFVEQDAFLPLPSFKVNPIKIDPVREK